MTDAEKAGLQQQLTEIQGEIIKRDQRIRELEHQLHVLQTPQKISGEELMDEVEGRTVAYSKFTGLKQKYGAITETLVSVQEECEELKKRLTRNKEKYKREKQDLIAKLEERQKQLEDERQSSQLPRIHYSLSVEDHIPVKDMDHETAVQEVAHLRVILSEKDNKISSLETQVKSFGKTAAEHQELEKQTKEQGKMVMDWRRKFEAAKVSSLAGSLCSYVYV